jgi:hypothetical protein
MTVGDNDPAGFCRDVTIQRSKAIACDGRITDPWLGPGSVDKGGTLN